MRSTLPLLLLLSACANGDGDGPRTDRYDPEHLTEVEVELADADWEVLLGEGRLFYDILLGPDCFTGPPDPVFTWQESDAVVVDGERLEGVGVRKKGFIGSLSSTRPSLKIDTDRFVPKQDFEDGTEHFTLNNNNQDPSRLHTCLAYRVFRDAGVPAPRCAHATVTVNGEALGVYSNVQPLKKDFLREQFGSAGGDLYEGTVSDFDPDWLATFDIKSDGSTLAPLEMLSDALETPDDQLLAALGSIVDLDEYITFWATESLIGHWDGYNSGRNNFYVHRHPVDRKLRFIPWGADAVFEAPDSDPVFAYSRLSMRLYNHPEGRALFLAETRRLLDEVWHEDVLHAEIDRVEAQIGPHIQDPEGQAGVSEDVRAFVDGRRAVVEAMLAEPPERPAFDNPRECWEPVGELQASFDTEWDTMAADPFTFAASLSGEVYGQAAFATYAGAQAGLNEDGEPQLMILGVDASLENLSGIVVLLRDGMKPGTVDIDIAATPAFAFTLDLTDPYAEPDDVVLLGGSLVLDEISFEPGGRISGSLDAIAIPNLF